MKTYYTLIAEDNELSLQSHFYCITVGASQMYAVALQQLQLWCSARKYYIAKRNRDDDLFRLKIAASLGVKVFQLPSMEIEVTDAVAAIKRQGSLPWQPADCHNYDHLQRQSSPTYFLNRQIDCLKRGRT